MEENRLYILWTNADPYTSHHMVMMYATNAMLHHWWDKVTVIIWGAPAKYVAEDASIKQRLEIARHAGVDFSACISCAVNLGVKEELDALGLEIKAWGEPLTEILKSNGHLLTV